MEMSRNGRFGPNPGREPFGWRFWGFRGSGAGDQIASMEMSRNGRFGPNPGREPFGARF